MLLPFWYERRYIIATTGFEEEKLIWVGKEYNMIPSVFDVLLHHFSISALHRYGKTDECQVSCSSIAVLCSQCASHG